MTPAGSFRAFVSYCHADRLFATRLQRRLESYRLPRRLVDRVAPLPGQPAGRIGPIFRDRADLSAAADLSEAVRDAIIASSALVVVTSPDAVRSHWIDREIALFRDHHPGAPILVAHARGDPATALPAALRSGGGEPLAADFRREGDGARLGFLKIVAGLAGLPLDALVQRDAQRQVRRVTAVTLGIGVLALVMAGLLLATLQARSVAEHRRAGAEGLVDFMRTTLRDKLKGEGSRRVMRAVNERALAYFDGQGRSSLQDESILLRAMVLHSLGEDDLQDGAARNIPAARQKFEAAYADTAAVLARHPAEGDAVFAHAQSAFWIGDAAWKQRDRAATTRFWNDYRAAAATLARIEPGTPRSLMELGYAEGDLCDLNFTDQHDLTAALRHCREAIRYIEAALAARPRDPAATRLDLANRFGWLARVDLARGDHAAALAHRTTEARLVDLLIAADKQNIDYTMRRAWPDIGMAKILIDTGHPGDAATLLAQRWAQYEPRLSDDRSRDFCNTGLRIVLFLARAQRLAGSPAHPATEARAAYWMRWYAEQFPDAKDEPERLRKDIG